jgi:hypothetical protein
MTTIWTEGNDYGTEYTPKIKSSESYSTEVDGDYVYQGQVIGRVTDLKPNEWFGKVELSSMPEFAEYGYLDPSAEVHGDDGTVYKDPKGQGGTLLDDLYGESQPNNIWVKEAKGSENTGDFWWGKHVTWESGYDQDNLYCNHCNRELYAPASWIEPVNSITDEKMNRFVPHHLKTVHGITEPVVTFAGVSESKAQVYAVEHNGDALWDNLVDSSRRAFLDEYQGEMNLPLMLHMGALEMPQNIKEVAGATGMTERETVRALASFAKDNGWIDSSMISYIIGESQELGSQNPFDIMWDGKFDTPDSQGWTTDEHGNLIKSHPSQYTMGGWDKEKKERHSKRGDVDESVCEDCRGTGTKSIQSYMPIKAGDDGDFRAGTFRPSHGFPCNNCDSTGYVRKASSPQDMVESKSSEARDVFKCPRCSFKTSDDDSWSYHMQDHDEADILMKDAEQEFANYTDKDYERLGLKWNANRTELVNLDGSPITESKANEISDAEFAKIEGWISPADTFTSDNLECELCGQIFEPNKSEDDMYRHFRIYHPDKIESPVTFAHNIESKASEGIYPDEIENEMELGDFGNMDRGVFDPELKQKQMQDAIDNPPCKICGQNEKHHNWREQNNQPLDHGFTEESYTEEEFDSYNYGNPTDDLPNAKTVDDRIEDTQESESEEDLEIELTPKDEKDIAKESADYSILQKFKS